MTIRSIVRPKVYKIICMFESYTERAFVLIFAGIIITYSSPVWIPVVVKAWFDEESMLEAFNRVFVL